MIGVEDAKRIVMDRVPHPQAHMIALAQALGAPLASPVHAPHPHPGFDMSAVDGYAFTHDTSISQWTIVGTIAAGARFSDRPAPGECVRIFTGAMLPEGLDTVVMQEFTTRVGDTMHHADSRLVAGANVRRMGEQFRQGDLVLPQGTCLTPEALGLLATVGVYHVPVMPAPRVGVLVTGDEFVRDQELLPGRIFSSNDAMLEAALRMTGALPTTQQVPDDAAILQQAIDHAAASNDVILTTGGASVGEHDLVHDAVLKAGGTIHFHGVAQKPGKPMLFATVHGRPFFGLPGNPRAVIILFWEYVLPFLRAMRGSLLPQLRSSVLPLGHALTVKGDRAGFRAAQVRDGRVHLLADEGSHMLRTLVDADAIAYLPAGRHEWDPGDGVEIHQLPKW